MRPAFELTGAVALVTGGGSGIGRATGLALAALGARVAVTERPGLGARAEATVGEIRDAGGEGLALMLDVTAAITIPSVVDAVVARFGALDILVNNAGAQLIKPALDVTEDEFDAVVDVNLKGSFFCAQAAAAAMAEHGRGTIVNVASQHGVVGNVDRAPYCASKGGMVNLTRALAVEWAPRGIRVNAVSPTFVVNDHNADALATPEYAGQISAGVPLGRAARAQDVAGAICFLASPAAAMITGHNLMVDGGWTAR